MSLALTLLWLANDSNQNFSRTHFKIPDGGCRRLLRPAHFRIADDTVEVARKLKDAFGGGSRTVSKGEMKENKV